MKQSKTIAGTVKLAPLPPPQPAGIIPAFPISTVNPNWSNYLKYASTSPSTYGFGVSTVAHAWIADGRRNNTMRDWCVSRVRTIMSGLMADWNAGRNVGGSGGDYPVSYDSYLYAGDTLTAVLRVAAWMRDQFTAQELADIAMVCEQAVWNIWNWNEAKWNGVLRKWTGWATDDPNNNYFQRSFFPLTLLWAIYSQSQTWLDFLHNKLIPLFKQKCGMMVGGGVMDGTGYGQFVTRTLQNVWLYRAAFGIDISADIRVSEIVDYWVNCITPDYKSFAPIGNGNLPSVNHYERTIFSWGCQLMPTDPAIQRGRWLLGKIGADDVKFYLETCLDLSGPTQIPTAPSYFASYVGNLFARSADGAFMAFECGNNNGSHAQFGATQTQLYFAGKWREVSANAMSNSGDRLTVDNCNLIVFRKADGTIIPQKHAISTMTQSDDGNILTATGVCTPAYVNTFVTACQRQVTFNRTAKKRTTVDTFTLTNGATAEWSHNYADLPVLQGDGSYIAGPLTIRCLTPGVTSDVIDWDTTSEGWDFSPSKVWRLRFMGATEYTVEVTW